MTITRRMAAATAAAVLALAIPPSYAAPSSVKDLTGAGVADDTSTARASASADGRWVVYSAQPDASCASTLPPVGSGPTGPQCVFQVFLQDTKSGAVTMVSRTAAGPANADATKPTITSDGRLVLFRTVATNLVPAAKTGLPFLLYDRVTKKLSRIVLPAWAKSQDATWQTWARISGDGSAVVFQSPGNLATGAVTVGGGPAVYHLDRRRGVLSAVSVDATGAVAGTDGSDAAVSENGRHVAYASTTKVSASDTDTAMDVYVRDVVARTTIPVTATIPDACPPTESGCASAYTVPAIDAAGRLVSFAGNSYRGSAAERTLGTRDLRDGKTTIRSLTELGVVGAPNVTQPVKQALNGDGKVVYALLQGDVATGGYHTTIWRWPVGAAQATRVVGAEGAVYAWLGNRYSSVSTTRTGDVVVVTTDAALASTDTDKFYDVYLVKP